MNFYTAAEAPLFGERDQEIEQCAALVGEFSTRLLVLQGKSGTGKSSFLRAGLIPKLEQQGSPFYFLRTEKGNAEPTFVRCTDDPVSRIHALLVSALEDDPQLAQLPIGFRQAVGELLASAASDDRVETAAAILKVLAVLSEGLPQTLVLIIDQSEEILTLQASRDPNNRRKAFFYLLEELCLRSLDVRVIVALRTEFCGRFYDAFGINPSLRITSDVRAGLEQFMLGALPREGIVAAILRPTLATPIEGYGVPREQYRFKYGEGVAEHIAADLLSHCGDSSTLPVLQIACKALYNQVVIGKKCPKITIEHYKALGGVKGRVDAYIDDVLRGALQETGATTVSPADLVRWRRVLATLAARQEGNAVTTLIRADHDIVNEAGRQELRGDIPKILKTLAKHKWRLLRSVVGSTNGAARQYSLGHDALAVALLKWDEAQQGLESAERERLSARRKLQKYSLAFLCLLLFIGGSLLWKEGTQTIDRSKRLIEFSNVEQGGNFRLRIQLLLAAKSLSDGLWSPFIDGDEARSELIAALAVSPILGGEGEAVGLDDAGTRIAVLRDESAFVIDLEGNSKGEVPAFKFAHGETLEAFKQHLPAIGFVSDMAAPVVYVAGYLYWNSGTAGSTQIQELSQDIRESQYLGFSPVGFASGFVQILISNRPNETENWIKVLRVTPRKIQDGSLPSSTRISWRGPASWPVISTQSDKFAFVGNSREQEIYNNIMLSSLSDPTLVSLVYGLPSTRNSNFDPSISLTFANSGNSLIVRDTRETLRILPSAQDRRARLLARAAPVVTIPEKLRDDPVQPRRLTMRPLLAAAKTDSEWRFAWLTEDGIAVIRSDSNHPENAQPVVDAKLLTGAADLANAFKLSFSKDGRFLVLLLRSRMQPQSRQREPMRYFVWDLDYGKADLQNSTNQALRDRACATAALDKAEALISPVEKFVWFHDSALPCPEPPTAAP